MNSYNEAMALFTAHITQTS